MSSSLYVHIPFCARKCFYCSFVVAVSAEKHADRYLECLSLEAQDFKGMPVETVYIGGGTPSRLSPDQIKRLMQMLKETFDCSQAGEITMEANPEDIQQERLDAMRSAGVNRISLGVQTFDEGYLGYLGRNHGARSAVNAAKTIRAYDFVSVNMDLMFGFEGQQAHEVKSDIDRMMGLAPDHISLYGLSVEPKSRFFAQGKVTSNDQQAEMYMIVLREMKENGFFQYEVSNFSRPGHESVHNRNYWLGKDYIGLGVGAHSHRSGRRWWNLPRINDYITRLESGKSAQEGSEQVSGPLRIKERFLFGLRMNEGADLNELKAGHQSILDQEQFDRIDTYIKEGLLVKEGERLKATDKGRLVLDEISSHLI